MNAGKMRERLYFQRRVEKNDGMGNRTSEFETVFTDAAELRPLRGGESVQAARLTGTQPFTVRVRSSTNTRAVEPSWRLVNVRSGLAYSIRTISNPDQKNGWLELLVEYGVAT